MFVFATKTFSSVSFSNSTNSFVYKIPKSLVSTFCQIVIFFACNIFRLFCLINYSQTLCLGYCNTLNNEWTTCIIGHHLSYYNTSVTCLDGTNIKATVCVTWLAFNSPELKHPDYTVAYIVGSLYFEGHLTVYIQAKDIKIIMNNLATSIPPIWSFFNTYSTCLNTVCAEVPVLNLACFSLIHLNMHPKRM